MRRSRFLALAHNLLPDMLARLDAAEAELAAIKARVIQSWVRDDGKEMFKVNLDWWDTAETYEEAVEMLRSAAALAPASPPGGVPPDVLARAVAAMNENRHDGTGNWNIDQNGEVYGRGRHRHCPYRMSPISAVAVAVCCYGTPGPGAELLAACEVAIRDAIRRPMGVEPDSATVALRLIRAARILAAELGAGGTGKEADHA
jgi:hypothetical protein